MAGGVFEEAIAIANLMLQGGQEIAQTVRTATFVDNTWKVLRVTELPDSLLVCRRANVTLQEVGMRLTSTSPQANTKSTVVTNQSCTMYTQLYVAFMPHS